MSVLFIGYPKCTTCKKAYATLQSLGIEAEYRNIKEENPTKEEICHWLDLGVDINKLWNTSGQAYRTLQLKDKRKTMSQEEMVDLLASDGMLVKRPIVIQGSTVIVGNKTDEYSKLSK